MNFLDKLEEIEKRYDDLTVQLAKRNVLEDPALYQRTAKAHSELSAVVDKYRDWKGIRKGLEETKALRGRFDRRRDESSGARGACRP